MEKGKDFGEHVHVFVLSAFSAGCDVLLHCLEIKRQAMIAIMPAKILCDLKKL